MKDGSPFGIAGIWENWKHPASGEWIRTFAIITTDANDLVADVHDRMPVILAPRDYDRWLGEEPDPRDLMRPHPAEPMRMWPISTRVNKPEKRRSVDRRADRAFNRLRLAERLAASRPTPSIGEADDLQIERQLILVRSAERIGIDRNGAAREQRLLVSGAALTREGCKHIRQAVRHEG
jgi:hypothetical protein